MKRFLCMLMACLLLCASAAAAPRLPAKGGAVVDDAAVLTQQTVEELTKLHELVKKDTGVSLHVVTVDFLDGYDIDAYGKALTEAWDAGDDALLLLLAVGEDKCSTFSGRDVKLSASVQRKLVSSSLTPAFLRQDYDEAIRTFMPALITELNKTYGTRITLDGMFGVQDTELTVDWFQWAENRASESRRIQEDIRQRSAQRVQQEDDDGISLGKIILTFLFLSMIFSRRGRRGCGCAPFAGMFGLWKLWDRH